MGSIWNRRLKIHGTIGLWASLILLTLCGASQITLDPADEIVVTQQGGVVQLCFYWRDRELDDLVAVEATSLTVRLPPARPPSGQSRRDRRRQQPSQLTYGVVANERLDTPKPPSLE